MSDLAQRLAKATGLPESLAEAVVQTALERIRALRPDLDDRVERVLADPEAVAEAAGWIAKLSEHLGARPVVADTPEAQDTGEGPAAPRDS